MHDDNELMIKAVLGDKSAYEKIVINNRMSAISFAFSYVKDVHIAEDIVQECFVKIYINKSKYKPTFKFKTYLFTVIKNKCIDHIRKNNTRQTVNIDDVFEISDKNTPEQQLLNTERSHIIINILNSLQNDFKTALYLYAVEEMSYQEIATVMQKTSAQIKITIYRARKKLKILYERTGIDEK